MQPIYDSSATKKPTNLKINADLLYKAKEMNINLSQALEQALERIVKEKQQSAWKETYRESIKNYNQAIAEDGVFSDALRRF